MKKTGLMILLLCFGYTMYAQVPTKPPSAAEVKPPPATEAKPPQPTEPPVDKVCTTCAEKDYSLIYYDFSCKKLYMWEKNENDSSGKKDFKIDMGTPVYKRFKSNEKIQFRIVNINRYMYDISVEGKDIKYESEMPALFNSLFYGDTANLLGTLLSRFSSGTSINTLAKVEGVAPLSEVSNAINEFYDSLVSFQQEYNELQEKKLYAFTSCPNLPCCQIKEAKENQESYADIANKLIKLRVLLSKAQLLMKDDEAIKKDRELLQGLLAKYKKEITTCETDLKALDDGIKTLTKERDDAKTKFDKESDKEKKTKAKEDLDAKEKELKEKTSDKKKLEESCEENKEASMMQILAKENDLKVYNDLNKLQEGLPSEQDLMALVLFLNNMIDQSNSYTTPPIFPKGNRLDLSIKISKSEDSFVSKMNVRPYDNDSVTIDIFIPMKPFVSFSSGSFIALGSYLQNKTYDWQALPNSTNTVTGNDGYILTENSYTAPPMGFSALVNVEWKTTPLFGFGFSGGVGLTIEEKPRMAYFAGHSLFFGDMRQLTFTAGLAAMQVEKLTNDWQSVSDQQIRYSGNTEGLSYYKELKVGPFISLTFTPFK